MRSLDETTDSVDRAVPNLSITEMHPSEIGKRLKFLLLLVVFLEYVYLVASINFKARRLK